MREYASCPRCSSTNTRPVKSTWWGGRLGPAILTHVQCANCGATYNGKTGTSNKPFIALYALGLFFVGFAASGGVGYAIERISWMVN
jgi:transposase-like protein